METAAPGDNPSAGGIEPSAAVVLPMNMFRRFLALFEDAETTAPAAGGVDQLQRAAAVLLVIAARLDGTMDAAEQASIERLLTERLKVEDAKALVEEAVEAAAESTDFFSVTRVINDRLEPPQRVDILEMLWEVVIADGTVHDYEANLIRRVAGLLHISDREAGDARKRVIGS